MLTDIYFANVIKTFFFLTIYFFFLIIYYYLSFYIADLLEIKTFVMGHKSKKEKYERARKKDIERTEGTRTRKAIDWTKMMYEMNFMGT